MKLPTTTYAPKKVKRAPSIPVSPPLSLKSDRRNMRYKELLETAPDAIVVVNQSGTIVLVNAQAEKLFGYSRAELIGRPGEILVCEHFRGQHNLAHSSFLAASPERPTLAGLELSGLRKDGTEFIAEIRLSQLDTSHGIVISSAIRDITGRSRTEEDLRRLASIVECSDDAIIGKTLEGIITNWNAGAERMYGYSAKEAIGRPVSMLVPVDRADELPEILNRLRRGQIVDHFETVRLTRDGKEFHIEITVSPIRDAIDNIVGASTIGRDVTERKHFERRLRQAQKMEAVGQLAGGIAHDFNNLLSIIIGYSDNLLERTRHDVELHRKCEEIKKAGDRAASLTRQLLTFSRQQVLAPRVFNLNTVVVEIGHMLRRLIGEDIEFRTSLDPTLGCVSADPGQIEQLIVNLVVNARDAMPDGGQLTIETCNTELDGKVALCHPPLAAGRYVQLAVSDTGIGMDEEIQNHLFEPFFTTKEPGKGTGLGLSIVYGVVKQSGGCISVQSKVGHGSVFKMYLPRVEELVQQSGSNHSAPQSFRGTETILLAEDDESVRTLTRSLLQDAGYTVIEAVNGGHAVEVAAKYYAPIHLLLTDVVMPGLKGPALAEIMSTTFPEMKALCMSGYPGTFPSLTGLIDRGVKLLQKPYSRDTLLRMVREALDSPNRIGRI